MTGREQRLGFIIVCFVLLCFVVLWCLFLPIKMTCKELSFGIPHEETITGDHHLLLLGSLLSQNWSLSLLTLFLLILLLLPVKIQYAKGRRRYECYLYLFLTPWSASFSKTVLTQSQQQHVVRTLLKQESNKRDQPDDPVKSLDGRHSQCEIGKSILKPTLICASVAGIVTLFSWMWEGAWEKIAAGWNSPCLKLKNSDEWLTSRKIPVLCQQYGFFLPFLFFVLQKILLKWWLLKWWQYFSPAEKLPENYSSFSFVLNRGHMPWKK